MSYNARYKHTPHLLLPITLCGPNTLTYMHTWQLTTITLCVCLSSSLFTISLSGGLLFREDCRHSVGESTGIEGSSTVLGADVGGPVSSHWLV